jgi:hypothetical protein
MDQKPIPRDPHPDNDLIDAMESEPGAQSSAAGGRLQQEVGAKDEEKSATGGDPQHTPVTGSEKVQPRIPTRADFEGNN